MGYGISAPAKGLDEYAGVDVKGKILLAFKGSPKDAPAARGMFGATVDPPKDNEPSKAKVVADFNRQLDGMIDEWKANNKGKRIQPAELQQMVDRLLLRGEILSGSWWKPDPNVTGMNLGAMKAEERARFDVRGFLSEPVDRARVSRLTGVPVENLDTITKTLIENEQAVTPDTIATVWRRAQELKARAGQ